MRSVTCKTVKKQLALLIVLLTYKCIKIWASLSHYYYSDGNKQNHYFQIRCKYYGIPKSCIVGLNFYEGEIQTLFVETLWWLNDVYILLVNNYNSVWHIMFCISDCNTNPRHCTYIDFDC